MLTPSRLSRWQHIAKALGVGCVNRRPDAGGNALNASGDVKVSNRMTELWHTWQHSA
jgi:hypothetical protein